MLHFVDALLSFFLEDMPPQPRWKTPETGDADDDDFDDDDDAKQQKKPHTLTKRFTMGYWQMRGLGAPLRMMLHWGKFDNANATKALMDDGKEAWTFEDVQYAQGPDGIAAWYKRDKKKIIEETNALANIPYLVDHEEKKTIVHFQAISAYLGQKLNFDEARVDSDQYARNAQIAMEVFDLRNTVRQLVYKFPNSVRSAEEFEKQLPEHLSACKKTYAKLENWLQFHDFTYFAKKDGVSSCDFHAFEMIDQHEHYQTLVSGYDGKSSLLSEYPRLKKFHEAMRNRAELKTYFESKEYLEFELNNHTLTKSWDGPGPAARKN